MSRGSVSRLKRSCILVSAVLVLMTSGCSVYAESPKLDTERSKDDLIAELLYLRADKAFLLDAADELTVDLEACEKLLEMERENPPECDGFPWLEVACGAIVGGATVLLLD